jgi:hypothetical protein
MLRCDRVHSCVQNIALLRVSADDARADGKLQGLDQDFDETVDVHVFDKERGDEDVTGADDQNVDAQAYYNAFLGVLSAARASEIRICLRAPY